MEKKVTTLKDAISMIKPGSTISVSGISYHRVPMEAVREIIRQGIKDLYFIDREPGLALDLLVGAGCVSKARFAMATFELLGLPPCVRRKAERGELYVLEDTCGALLLAWKAAGMGVEFIAIDALWGSDLVDLHTKEGTWRVIKCPFTNKELIAIKALHLDYLLLHAQRADEYGNVEIEGPKWDDLLKVKAAKNVIVTVEEIVDTNYFKQHPERLTIPYFYITAVVHVPKGAYPTSCYKFYPPDYEHIKMYLKMAREGKIEDYIKEYVLKR